MDATEQAYAMWINSYKNSGWWKTLFKESYFLFRFGYLFLLNALRVRTVLFYPEYPVYKSEINKVLRRAGYNITNNPSWPHQHIIAWRDTTLRGAQPRLEEWARAHPVLNLTCTDISKEKVERVFQSVFGYGLALDPCQHHGPCVRKSNANAQHDGQIIDCPIETREPGYIYQRLIDNQVAPEAAGDLRAPIYGGRIPLVFVRFRPLTSRFDGDYLERVGDVESYLSGDEIARVIAFARGMGLDYGDVDMLRDPADDRLYIVDVNNTPRSPAHRSRRDVRRSVERGRRAFEAEFGAARTPAPPGQALPR
ncbi:MAG: hypothetical protein L0H83_05705 [Salinisphaera sp.]|nr:hypothetical protein [Salinisphaera sp.]